jgi:hypothetical protein
VCGGRRGSDGNEQNAIVRIVKAAVAPCIGCASRDGGRERVHGRWLLDEVVKILAVRGSEQGVWVQMGVVSREVVDVDETCMEMRLWERHCPMCN